MSKGIEKKCIFCGEKYLAKKKDSKYCSSSCGAKYRRRQKKYYCIECGKELPLKRRKFCNEICTDNYYTRYNKENPKYTKICELCGKEYKTNQKNQKFCSRGCQWEQQEGNQYGDEQQREQRFKEQFELLNPKFKYHSEYKGSEDYFKSECRECGYIEERHAQCARPSREDTEIRCKQCGEIIELKQSLIDILMKRHNDIIREQNKLITDEIKKERQIELDKQRQKDLITVCQECGEIFQATSMGMKYCSKRCASRMYGRMKDISRRWRIRENGKVDKDITLTKLIKRDKGICHICNKKCDSKDYIRTEQGHFIVGKDYPSLDHVIPISKGGTHTWDNVKLAHHYCNSIKNNNEVYEEGTGQLKIVM
ncbi:MAG TPA: HNH endonuclease signature motif containing protein [Tissierellaceae bacterium]|nr:HNH endonuclease signature motif containing protein [Tissierellaceae bacterium]